MGLGKWRVIFATFMTGELFGAISRETILSHAVADADEAEDTDAFKPRPSSALRRLRSRPTCFPGAIEPASIWCSASSAREKISGTLIGLELAAWLAGDRSRRAITLIASGRLQVLYRLAFDTLSVEVRSINAEDAARRGLSMAADSIWKV
jgi:2-dehydro-3-deoxygalactonokinase